jgi:hypothetical protein
MCSACHLSHHRGALAISGTAEHIEVTRHAEPSPVTKLGAHVDAVADAPVGVLETAIVRTQAKDALIGLGWRPAIAQAAVAAAFATLGAEVTLERLIFEALRRCRQPTS